MLVRLFFLFVQEISENFAKTEIAEPCIKDHNLPIGSIFGTSGNKDVSVSCGL